MQGRVTSVCVTVILVHRSSCLQKMTIVVFGAHSVGLAWRNAHTGRLERENWVSVGIDME